MAIAMTVVAVTIAVAVVILSCGIHDELVSTKAGGGTGRDSRLWWMMELAGLPELARSVLHVVLAYRLIGPDRKHRF